MKTSPIYFLTGNKNKYQEIANSIPGLRMLTLNDLPEIQSLDIQVVIREKLRVAVNQTRGRKSLLVEDTGLYLASLNGFPGPLIKFLLTSVGNDGIFKICRKANNLNAYATTAFGFYSSETKDVSIHLATVKGTISKPKGKFGFGWDQVFVPHNSDKTFAEMGTLQEKNQYSMRAKALKKFYRKVRFL